MLAAVSFLLQRKVFFYSCGSSRLNFSSISSGIKQNLTESFIKRMLTSAKHLNSTPDFKFWYKRLAKFYIKEGELTFSLPHFDLYLHIFYSGVISNFSVKRLN